METQRPKISWRNILLGIAIGAILVALIAITSWYFTRPKESENSSTNTTKTATTSANKKVTVTLQVTQLETTFGAGEPNIPEPPKSINVSIPIGYSGKLAAYYVDGVTIVGPASWTGKGIVGADGNSGIDLHPISNIEKGSINVVLGSPGTGPAVDEAAPYFPFIQEHWSEFRNGIPMTGSPPGIVRTFISNHLIKYTLPNTADGLEVDGVAYSDAEGSDLSKLMIDFEKMEVTLPASEHDLAIVILDTFISMRGLK